MADSLVDIALKFKVIDLETVLSDFKKLTESATLTPQIKADTTLIALNMQDAINLAMQQMKAGELDPGALGLNKIVSNLETLARNYSKKFGDNLAASLKPLQDEAFKVNEEIDKLNAKLLDIEKQKGKLTPESAISAAKKETGFTGKAINAESIEQAEEQLKKLQEVRKAGDKSDKTKEKIDFYKELVKQYQAQEEKLKKLNADEKSINTTLKTRNNDILRIENELKKQKAENTKKETAFEKELNRIIQNTLAVRTDALDVQKKITQARKDQNQAARDAVKTDKQEAKGLGEKATQAFSYYLVFNQLKKVFNDTLRTIRQLDHSMTEAAIATSMNRKEAWALLGTYQNLARTTGLATSEIASVVTQFLRQGRSVKDALELAEVAAMSAKVASISANDAVNYLTSAVNGFGLAAKDSEMIADKFAAIAAQSATSFEELAKAMSKVSPTAKSAGVGVDFMMGVIAKGIETTREAPENIGTAFKTIFARMREVTDLGKAMEDGMDLNRVEKALLSVGVPLRDVSGQFRNLEQVLIDVGEKWDTLTSVEQAYLATALAGSRQQPRLLAIFNDFARTKELIQISAEATGELANQHYEYMQGSEAALTNLRTSWEQLTMAFVDTEAIVFVIQSIANVLKAFGDLFQGIADSSSYFTLILVALGIALSGLATKFMQNITLLGLQFLATALNAAQQKALNKELKMSTKEFQKLTIAQKLKTISDLKTATSTTTVIAALKAKAVAALAATKAFFLLMASMWPLLLIAAALIAIVGLVAWGLHEAGKNADYFATEVKKTNKEISELNAKERDLKKLVDRFNELNKITNKTAQQFDEMNDLAEQLSNYDYDGQTFNLTRTDVTGRIVIDQSEYNRLLKLMDDKRKELFQKNVEDLKKALNTDFEGTLNNQTLINVFAQIGYDYGVEFIDAFGNALDENLKNRLVAAARRVGQIFTMDQFRQVEEDGYRVRYEEESWRGGQDEWEDKIAAFDTLEEAEAFIAQISEDTENFRDIVLDINYLDDIDLEAYKQFVESMLGNLEDTLSIIDVYTKNIFNEMPEGIERTAAIFDYSADAYRDAEQHLRDTIQDPELLQQAIQFLGESMFDEAILNDLINNKQIDAKVVARLAIDLNLTDIQKIFDDFKEEFRQAIIKDIFSGRMGGVPLAAVDSLVNSQMNNLEYALNKLFNNTEQGVQAGYSSLKVIINSLVASGQMTVEEGKKKLLEILNAVKALSMQQVADLLKDQMELSKKIFDLPNQIAKGDLSTFASLVEQYGLAATKALLSGNEDSLVQFFEAQNAKAISQIDESIALIIAKADAAGRTMDQLTDIEKQQIAALEIMKEYYDDIATQEALRNWRLGEAKDLLKQMNDILSIQQKLMDLGVGGSILDIFSTMAESYYSEGLGFLTRQMETDLAALDQYLGDDGYFDPDQLGAADAAIQRAIGTFGQLIDAVTAAYNRQKKEIEERYKTEIDAIKKANNERWSQIDFTNKLADAEEKIIEARRKLMGLVLSGVSRGTLEQAQKDLKKLQEERQKIIEQQMVDEATKQLELDMQDELIEVQQELTEVLNSLIGELEALKNVFIQNEGQITPTVPVVNNFSFTPLAQASLDSVTVSNNRLVETNEKLITSVDRLATVMGYKAPTASAGVDRGLIEDFDVTSTIGITRM